jgi:hypothetical protein
MDFSGVRVETARETALEYRPGEHVVVTVLHRERRLSVTDRGAGLRKAGSPPGWRDVAARIVRELDVNVTRRGEIWLPVVAVGPGLESVTDRVAAASQALYQDVLELQD